MKHRRVLPIILAALLQLAPLYRTICTGPAVNSTFAIILKWGVGLAATLGTFDAVSAASNVYFTCPTNATGYVGVAFQFLTTITNYGSDKGATFGANPLPTGLSISNYDHPPQVYGVIYGTPAAPTNKMQVHLVASYPGQPSVFTNIYMTILAASKPVITNEPAPQTTITAGYNATFEVVAGGNPTPKFQWRFNGGNLLNFTNSSMTRTNARTNQAGIYTVVVTNTAGAITSSPAQLTVNLPPLPNINLAPTQNGNFVFSFSPAVGLTNTVQTNGAVGSGAWNTLTNIAPPTSATNVTITNPIDAAATFFRVKIDP